MLIWLIRLFHKRAVQVSLATSYTITLTACLAALLHQRHVDPARAILIEVLLAGLISLFIERVADSERAIAFLVRRDLAISVGAALLVLALAFVLAFTGTAVETAAGGHDLSPTVARTLYLGLGIVFGGTLRWAMAELASRALLGLPRFGTTILIVSTWFLGLAISLLPAHRSVLPSFLAGVAFGALLQRGVRLRIAHAASSYRRLFEVLSNFPKTIPLSHNERKALQLLGDWRSPWSKKFVRLRRHLDACKEQGDFNKRLRLVSACAYRLEGRYAEAIAETDDTANPPHDNVDAQLLLVRALTLEDRGDQHAHEIESLGASIMTSSAGRWCPLTRALVARRAAEHCVDANGHIAFEKEPLELVIEAIDLRGQGGASILDDSTASLDAVTEFFRGFVAHGVPVTPSWLMDVFGYALLMAGCPDEGRVHLQACITTDPSYSYGYLHLGDYFLYKKTSVAIGSRRPAPPRDAAWHARACYLVASKIEGQASSRVRRLAEARLKLLDALTGGADG